MLNVSRRSFLKLSSAAVLAPALHSEAGGESEPAPASRRRPNVLVILTDQQQAGMLSCAGNPWLKTPHLDALAARGVRFERAYCANPVCVPSRFSMFTGLLPSVIGMEKNDDDSLPVPQSILDNTMGSLFRGAGYETAYGGKIHLPGQEGVRGRIEPYGFDYISPDDLEGRDALVEDCAQFLRRQRDKPFLLVASFINPHDICYMATNAYRTSVGQKIDGGPSQPCLEKAMKRPDGVAEQEFWDKYCPPLPPNYGITENEPEALTSLDWRPHRGLVRANWTERDWRLHGWAYARLTESVDAQIGRVLDALREAGLERNTVVVFTSDHGDMNAAHRLENKSMPYEESVRVPFIVSRSEGTKGGAVDREHLVSSGLDLVPTICDYAGIPVPGQLLGRSVRRLAEGATIADWRKHLVVENEQFRMLHLGRTKYVAFDHGSRREQYMDLEKDPGEMRNFAADAAYEPQVREGRRLLKEWYRTRGLKLDAKYVVDG